MGEVVSNRGSKIAMYRIIDDELQAEESEEEEEEEEEHEHESDSSQGSNLSD